MHTNPGRECIWTVSVSADLQDWEKCYITSFFHYFSSDEI